MRHDGAAAKKHAGEIDSQDFGPDVHRAIHHIMNRAVDAGIVDQDVDLTRLRQSEGDGLLNRGNVGDIDDIHPKRFEPRHGLVKRGKVEIPEDDPGAFLRQAPRNTEANASRAAGDDGGMAFNAE
jgi:hypothetical protein